MSEGRQSAEKDAGLFIGSSALMTALYDTYTEHIGITEPEGPDGPYIWCACGWRSDDLLSGPPGESYAVHLINAQHAAAVKALQPLVRRVLPPAESPFGPLDERGHDGHARELDGLLADCPGCVLYGLDDQPTDSTRRERA